VSKRGQYFVDVYAATDAELAERAEYIEFMVARKVAKWTERDELDHIRRQQAERDYKRGAVTSTKEKP
jgi:hypothetical protein